MIHPSYKQLLTSVFGVDTIVEGIPKSQFTKFFENAMSRNYEIIDELNVEVTELKQQHLDEVLELKLKLSDLIDTNYNLLQELRKQNVNPQTN